METILIKLTTDDSLKALKELERKRLIQILESPDLYSWALPGEKISEESFKQWVEYAEESPTVSKTEAEKQWAKQKKRFKN